MQTSQYLTESVRFVPNADVTAKAKWDTCNSQDMLEFDLIVVRQGAKKLLPPVIRTAPFSYLVLMESLGRTRDMNTVKIFSSLSLHEIHRAILAYGPAGADLDSNSGCPLWVSCRRPRIPSTGSAWCIADVARTSKLQLPQHHHSPDSGLAFAPCTELIQDWAVWAVVAFARGN